MEPKIPPNFSEPQVAKGNPPLRSGIREQLQALISNKKRQLTLVGTLGQRLLSQEIELEERIQRMVEAEIGVPQSGDSKDIAPTGDELESLGRTLKTWEVENQETWVNALALDTLVGVSIGDL
ncbi:uncharacterized protein EI90DRAFT_3070377 [Cantharellus anzutake]|uniref:uncharacterized protein n=1 Tax=Cantharellus anzutake TaxID=1750568 RepID=UPI001904307E|nr:uncharacterized protein EI90DRAFT_3070377 [Cantharellus anzutake]KAF8326317.1 hypothetical protein EI90DRAFT_3070377 [Cantharellus anzutake]